MRLRAPEYNYENYIHKVHAVYISDLKKRYAARVMIVDRLDRNNDQVRIGGAPSRRKTKRSFVCSVRVPMPRVSNRLEFLREFPKPPITFGYVEIVSSRTTER